MNPNALAAFDALPNGGFEAEVDGRRWRAAKTCHVDGRAQKIVAQAEGGPDRIGANIYRLSRGARLFPCEMTEKRVVDWLLAARVVRQ